MYHFHDKEYGELGNEIGRNGKKREINILSVFEDVLLKNIIEYYKHQSKNKCLKCTKQTCTMKSY